MINWFMHMYPYGNLHELNLDWVIDTVKRGEKEIADFIGINTIKYADPILWNIESQYEANTVVVDAQTGNAYISVKPVPSGVHLNRTEYWTQIYNYANVVDTLREQIAHNEGESTTATQPYHVNDLVFINGELYKVTHNMIAGDSFVVDSNIEKTTIEHELDRIKSNIDDEATARQQADTQLQTDIDNEALARAQADTQLQTDIDNLILPGSIYYYVEDYGAGNSSNDDTQAFLDCIEACPVGGTVANRVKGYTFKIQSTVAINKKINFIIDGKINYYGSGVCIDINPALSVQLSNCIFYIKALSDANGNSAQPVNVNRDGTIGIRINNLINSKIVIGDLQRFTHAGMYFNTNTDTGSSPRKICLHNYIEVREVANCGFGIYMQSLDAATACTQANEFHFIWLLQCYDCLVVDEDSNYYASDSNLFFITAIDNATDHGILVNGRYNIFIIAFMSTNIYFNTDSKCNYVRLGNNTSTDAQVYYGGSNNDVNLATPDSLPSTTTPKNNVSYQNTYGCKVQINIQAYSTDGTNIGVVDVQLGDSSDSMAAIGKMKIDSDSTSSNRNTYSFIVPAGCFYKFTTNNATLYRSVISKI